MKTKNVPAEVMKRVESLEKKKAEELAAIQNKIDENARTLAEAEKEIKTATESTDLTAYQAAKQKKHNAIEAVEMYRARYSQLENKAFVTRKDSDATIDNLLKYEKDIEAEFKEAIAEPLENLKAIYKEYRDGVTAAETTIDAWTHRIHANYRSTGTTYADGTNVSPVPVPVRRTPFSGCEESALVKNFIDKLGE